MAGLLSLFSLINFAPDFGKIKIIQNEEVREIS